MRFIFTIFAQSKAILFIARKNFFDIITTKILNKDGKFYVQGDSQLV